MRLTLAFAALLVVSTAAVAQERKDPRRLESVTWNSVKHELTWVISKGEKKTAEGSYKPVQEDHYLINMDKATMSFNGETRRFSNEEASRVHKLMDLISRYAVESTIWWEQGQGQRMDEGPGTIKASAEQTFQQLAVLLTQFSGR